MKKRNIFLALGWLIAFVLWTVAVRSIDVQAIGPEGTQVGFATWNSWMHQWIGVHWSLYTWTDWLSLVPLAFMVGFAVLGLSQWIRRKSLRKVDAGLLALGGFYVAVAAAFLVFECFPVNYRPVLIEGALEASYPSSTTLLVLCVMPTAGMQLRERIANPQLRRWIPAGIAAFTVVMVLGRLLSGVHWVTDIVGGILLSAGFVRMYRAALEAFK